MCTKAENPRMGWCASTHDSHVPRQAERAVAEGLSIPRVGYFLETSRPSTSTEAVWPSTPHAQEG